MSHDKVALTVVRFLGAASIVGLIAAASLSFVALRYEGNSNAAVVIAIVGNLASAALASLGSILASTGKGAPQPVTVENKPSDPVNVTEAPAADIPPVVSSEFGRVDAVFVIVGTCVVALGLVLGTLLLRAFA